MLKKGQRLPVIATGNKCFHHPDVSAAAAVVANVTPSSLITVFLCRRCYALHKSLMETASCDGCKQHEPLLLVEDDGCAKALCGNCAIANLDKGSDVDSIVSF